MQRYLDPTLKAFIRYLEFPGDAPVVLYLAGLGNASIAVFPRTVFESGLAGQRSVLVDLFGFGFSDKPDEYGYSLEEHAKTLSGLLDELGAKKYILVGHSLGGAVAIELAAMRPDVVVQIILAEAILDAGGGLWSRAIAQQTEDAFVKSGYQAFIDEYRSAALAGDERASIALGMLQVASPLALHRSAVSVVRDTQPVMWDKLIRMSIPKTYIFGVRSLEEYEEDRALYARLEAHGIRVDVVPDAGHAMTHDNPVAFAFAIQKAIRLTNQPGSRRYH